MDYLNCSGIYYILNKINGKIYIGSAVNIRKRFTVHKCDLRKGNHHSDYLQKSWNKYGEENFEFDVHELCNKEKLLEREQFWIDFFHCTDREKGYNICLIAGNTLGYKHTEEDKQKMSKDRPNSSGELNGMSKINQDIADEIRFKYENEKTSYRKLAKEYDLALRTVVCIIKGLNWVSKEERKINTLNYLNNKQNNIKLTEQLAEEIRYDYSLGNTSYKKLAKKYGVGQTTIARIIKNITWKNGDK